MKNCNLNINRQTNELKIMPSTLGHDVIDLGNFTGDFYFQDLGLKHTSFCQSSICYIDGENSTLLYRGYKIEEIAKRYDYVSTSYLLQHGELPSQDELDKIIVDYKSYLSLPKACYATLETLPTNLHAMSILLILIGLLSGDESNLIENHIQMSRKIIAQMPILVAMAQRHALGKMPVMPRKDLGYVENFLYMLNGEIPDKLTTQVIDSILTLHAEHEQNASTCTLRVSGSTGNNAYARRNTNCR